jgi:hypothetical protein
MKKKTKSLKVLLEGASRSARLKAYRKNQPIAISEDGEVKLIYPDKKVRVIHKAAKVKAAS